jgi:hypothetical protein
MSLPKVKGWIIDYRTACDIFDSQSNIRIAHCIARCQDGSWHVCHFEEEQFRKNPTLKGPFIADQYRVYEPDDDVYQRCPTIAARPNGKPILVGNQAAVFITATAASKNFGVISDHKSLWFATVHDLCGAYGVPVLTADQYFAHAPP